jgi:alpha-D-xyloside xylohydrolase
MPFRPPLVPHETFVADPPDLPIRAPGEEGLSALRRAEVLGADLGGVTLKGTTSDGGSLVVRLHAVGEGVIRVRLSSTPDAQSRTAALLTMVRPAPYAAVVSADGRTVRVEAGELIAEATLDPWHLRFLDPDGTELLAQNGGERDISGRLRTLPFGRSLVDGEVAAYHESFTAPGDERFVGLGEKFTPLDKRGQRALMWNFDAFGSESDRSHKCVPFYLSSRGYGILVDSGTPVEFDMCQSTHSCVQILVPDDLIDYYVLAGPDPGAVLERFDRLTGRPALPPKWAFGTWMSSGFFEDSQDQVLARAARIRAAGIPCDVLHLDCYWQTAGHWSDLAWDRDAFPDPTAMLASLAADGFKVSLWINPYVSVHSPQFTVASARGYFLTDQAGATYVADVWHGSHPPGGIVDFTNPGAVAWFTGLLKPLLKQGVAVFKTDFGEGVPADAVAYNGMSGTTLHNVYALLFNDVVSGATREAHGHGLVWARSSYLGGQRHAAQWSGDAAATWPSLASTLRGGLSIGLSGIPFWSHDAGGFHGTPTPALYASWAQFGALSPLVRFHGTTSRLPWDFPADAADVAVEALRLRYKLMPYLYTAAVTSARTGAPMLRALLVDHPHDPSAWIADQQFLLGPDLLVAPVTAAAGARDVYLPDGDWIDFATFARHEGRRWLRVEGFHLYVRAGALIATVPVGPCVGDAPFADVTLVSWGGTSTRAVVSDVDGDTSLRAVRRGDVFEVTVDGPLAISTVDFAPVPGASTPSKVVLR